MAEDREAPGVDAEYEAAEDEHDLRDHYMWLNGFRSACWEITRAELRAAHETSLRNIANSVYDIDAAESKSRTALIREILANKETFRWGPS